MVKANALNLSTARIVGFNGTSFVGFATTQYAVLAGASTSSAMTSTGPGTAGQIFQSNGSATPQYSTATYPSGSVTSRKILVSDGTNIVASTETYAVPGTSGNVMTSDGTNWVSSAPPTGSLFFTQLNVTNAQLKTAFSLQLIPAQGANTVIVPIFVGWKLKYGGSNVFTNNPTTRLNYSTAVASNIIATNNAGNAFWQQASDTFFFAYPQINELSSSNITNVAVYYNSGLAATGNAAGDNTVTVNCLWYISNI